MAKNKLMRFQENLTFPNLFQFPLEDVKNQEFPLKGRWNRDFFQNDNPIVLELGCGKGEYTVGLAERFPGRNFIGVDIKGARLWRGCKTSVEKQMQHVAFIRTRIEFIDYFFAAEEVSEVWITFPDPQPKKPNKRLSSQRMLGLYEKILKKDALCHLKTDSKELYEYTLNEVLLPNQYQVDFYSPDIYLSDYQGVAKDIQTHYEVLFMQKGHLVTYIQFRYPPR